MISRGFEAVNTPQIAQWVWGAELLAMVALRYSQNTYASLAKSLQHEWQYLQRAVPDCGVAFELVEEAIRLVFIPALLQATEAECNFLVQDYDQPWVRGRKYRIWGVFWFYKKKTFSPRT
jgi:hypothetical protein